MKASKLTIISGSIVFLFLTIAIFTPFFKYLVGFSPDTPSIIDASIFEPPGVHWFGTDRIGRDVAALLVYGIRNALFFSVLVVSLSTIVGLILGGVMGFFGGRTDLILSRVLEIIGNFPIFFLQLTLLAFFPQSYGILFFVMMITGWIPYCRITRAEFLKLRNQEFVQAARAIGCSRTRIFFRHLLPNAWIPSVIYIPFDLSSTVVALGALSFLGFGEPINVPSIGELMNQAREYFQTAWWLAVFPGLTLFTLTLSLTLFGSGLRDLIDPKN
jgi:ABC-type dipeptide/oligopeptide/nickel transport system permease subunit